MKLLKSKRAKAIFHDINKFQTSIILALIGLSLIGIGLSVSEFVNSSKEPQFIESGSEDRGDELTVDVSGAVKNPGVYSFVAGTRVVEVIEAAGGFAENANKDFVAGSINLAEKISDGEKIFIPAQGQSGSVNPSVASSPSGVSGVININTASESQLDTLYGIGPVRAEKIVANRPYSSVEELVTKKVLGESTLEKIKDKITVY